MKKILCALFLCLSTSAWCATATLYLKTAGGNWSAAGTWSTTSAGGADNSGPPDATTNVILELLSGNLTLDADGSCRSIDETSGTGSYTGTITHNGAVTLSIGDGTPGTGNVALKFNSAATYTFISSTTSILKFVSTSSTSQGITSAGENMATMTFDGVGGVWALQDTLTQSTGNVTLNVSNGSFNTNTQTLAIRAILSSNSNVRTIDITSSTVGLASTSPWVLTTVTNLTLTTTGSTINCTASGLAFAGGGKSYNIVNLSGAGSVSMTGANTFATFNRTGTSVKTDTLSFGATQTVTGTLTLAGNSITNRLLVQSSTLGSAIGFTNSGANMAGTTNVDFRDITMGTAYDGSAASTGNCGGCSGITFTTAATQYWFKDTGNFSTTANWFLATGGTGGAGRIPLPQDDVVFDASSFSAGSKTVTVDMPRFAKSVTWTGATNSPTFTMSQAGQTLYGSLTFIAAMTVSSSQSVTFEGRGSFTLTSATRQITSNPTINMVGGTLTFQDAFSLPSSTTFIFNNGTLDTGGFSVSVPNFQSSGSSTRTLTLGNSTITLSGTGSVWNTNSGGLTVTANTSTFLITDTSSSSKTFSGSGKTYNDLTITGSGTGAIIFQNNNTFRTITTGAPKTLTFTQASNNTIKRLIAMGSSGNVITLNTNTGGSAATLTQVAGQTAGDWLSIQDITFTGGGMFYAGYNSTSVSGNSGITFKVISGANQASFCGN